VRNQLLVALIALVDGIEERHGVGGVNEDRDLHRRGRLPHRRKASIVGQDQLATFVAHTETDVLPDL
jgi:hypothetical protein